MATRTIRIGTRGSRLARWQADLVEKLLRKAFPDRLVEQIIISTTGDMQQRAPLSSFGGVGVFTKEIERALLDDAIDVAVHSLKDLPTAQPDGLALGAVLEREDPRDALVSRTATSFASLRRGAKVATSSVRRRAQLLHRRPDLEMLPIRGNVPTRVKKLEEEGLDAIVLARAGLVRLGMADVITEVLPPEIVLPAPGQGAIAIEIRVADAEVAELVRALHHEPTAQCVAAERAAMRALGGGCHIPLGALARIDGTTLVLETAIASLDGRTLLRRRATGPVSDGESLGTALGQALAAAGGEAIIRELAKADAESRDE